MSDLQALHTASLESVSSVVRAPRQRCHSPLSEAVGRAVRCSRAARAVRVSRGPRTSPKGDAWSGLAVACFLGRAACQQGRRQRQEAEARGKRQEARGYGAIGAPMQRVDHGTWRAIAARAPRPAGSPPGDVRRRASRLRALARPSLSDSCPGFHTQRSRRPSLGRGQGKTGCSRRTTRKRCVVGIHGRAIHNDLIDYSASTCSRTCGTTFARVRTTRCSGGRPGSAWSTTCRTEPPGRAPRGEDAHRASAMPLQLASTESGSAQRSDKSERTELRLSLPLTSEPAGQAVMKP